MRVLALLLILPALSSAAPVPKETKGADKLDGLWELTTLQYHGQASSIPQGMKWKIEGEKVTVNLTGQNAGAAPATYTIKLDPAAKSRTLDWHNELDKTTHPAIYEVEGDSLKLLMATAGNERPKILKAGDKAVLYTFKRVKE